MHHVLTEILIQHEQLRAAMERCEQLADELDAGRGSPEQLVSEIQKLRVAFDQHNKAEEQQLRPLLCGRAMGDIRIDRLVSEHVSEHTAMRQRFTEGPTSEMRQTLAMLRDHLETEERYFMSRRIGS